MCSAASALAENADVGLADEDGAIDEEDERMRSPPKVGERLEIYYLGTGGGWFFGKVVSVEPLDKRKASAPVSAVEARQRVRCMMLMEGTTDTPPCKDGPFNMTTTTWRRRNGTEGACEEPKVAAHGRTLRRPRAGASADGAVSDATDDKMGEEVAGKAGKGVDRGEGGETGEEADKDVGADSEADAGDNEAQGACDMSAAMAAGTAPTVTREVELVVPLSLREDRKVFFFEGSKRYSVMLPAHLSPGDAFRAKVLVKPKVSIAAPPPAVTVEEFLHNVRRAARLKRKHTELKQAGVVAQLEAHLREAEEAASEEAAHAFEQSLPGATVTWAHPPELIPVGGPSAKGRQPAGGWHWVAMDGQHDDDELDAEIAAQVTHLVGEKQRHERASWLPKEGSLRSHALEALKLGIRERDDIYTYISELPGVIWSADLKTTLRSSIVTMLGKEKFAKVPLFEQDDTTYTLTSEGRHALMVADGSGGDAEAPVSIDAVMRALAMGA